MTLLRNWLLLQQRSLLVRDVSSFILDFLIGRPLRWGLLFGFFYWRLAEVWEDMPYFGICVIAPLLHHDYLTVHLLLLVPIQPLVEIYFLQRNHCTIASHLSIFTFLIFIMELTYLILVLFFHQLVKLT